MKGGWNSEIQTSHHPLHQKLGKSKHYWIDATTSYQTQDREKEVEHITKALKRCGYLSWTIKKIKEQQSQKGKDQGKEG